MEHGEESSKIGKSKMSHEEIAELKNLTVNKIRQIHRRERMHQTTVCTFHDMTSPGYGWLLPGWVAEERHVKSGRVYRYYYDPNGTFYATQQKVIEAFEKNGIIVIDRFHSSSSEA